MSRADQLLPEGWKPTRQSVVHVEPTKDEPAPPHGLWRVFDRAPGAGCWWLLPVDEAARTWAQRFPGQVVSGCITRKGQQLIPRGYRRPRASDLSAGALQSMGAGGRR